MRTLRLSLVGTVMVVLLGGPGGVATAQDETTAPEQPVAVTGTVTSMDVQSYGNTVTKDGIYHTEGPWWKITWEASDPRLSGQGTQVSNWIESESNGLGIGSSATVLVNPDGRWVGTGTGIGGPTWNYGSIVLHGEGAYEGLTAYVAMHADPSGDHTFDAIIYGGELMAVPEPMEPAAE